MKLKGLYEYGIGNTPLYNANKYCTMMNLNIKLEGSNPHNSVKDRTGYYIIKDLYDRGMLNRTVTIVESSSGNLGLALGYFSKEVGVDFYCLVDNTISSGKLSELEDAGIKVHMVSMGYNVDSRTARIRLAQRLALQQGWIWTNQYSNPANFRAHYETTGPEIWNQTSGNIDFLICAVGTGGTICGTAHYLKHCNPKLRVIAVEPKGSTIFGGSAGCYLGVGAGMAQQSAIFEQYGSVVDYFCKVDDNTAIQHCVYLLHTEKIYVGITTGAALAVARNIAIQHPNASIVAISPDDGRKYPDVFDRNILPDNRMANVEIIKYRHKENLMPPI